MKYFFDIVHDVTKNKNIIIINKPIDYPNANDIVLFYKELDVSKNDIINSQNRYCITREGDFVGEMQCDDESNFLMGYTSSDVKFDNHPNLFFPTNHTVSQLFIDFTDYVWNDKEYVIIKYNVYQVMNKEDRKKIWNPPFVITNSNKKLISFVHCCWFDSAGYREFDSINDIQKYEYNYSCKIDDVP